jgi:hypothetical protein
MATSNNTSWDQTRNELIATALRKLGVIQEGQTPSTEQYTNGEQALNGVVTLLSTVGMPLWKRISLPVTLTSTQTYTIPSALKIAQVVLVDTGGTQYDLIEKSLYDFNRLPTNNTGVPVHYTFQPKIQDGTLKIWPLPDAGTLTTKSLTVVYQKEFDGFFASGETPDFPSYWMFAIIYNLAVALAPEYGVPIQDRQILMKEAEKYQAMAEGYGDEDGSLYFQPDPFNYKR